MPKKFELLMVVTREVRNELDAPKARSMKLESIEFEVDDAALAEAGLFTLNTLIHSLTRKICSESGVVDHLPMMIICREGILLHNSVPFENGEIMYLQVC